MIFLTSDDFEAYIKTDVLTNVISNDSTVLDKAELSAIEELSSYLRLRYDIAAVLSETGSSRNAWIITLLVDMTLYHVHSRINPRQVPQLRMDRYDAAIEWLKSVAKGNLAPALPVLANEAKSSGITFTGETKRHNTY
jgi:phage gp36-like protein